MTPDLLPSLMPIDSPAATKFCWRCRKYFCFCDMSINWHTEHNRPGPSSSQQPAERKRERVVRRIVENDDGSWTAFIVII